LIDARKKCTIIVRNIWYLRYYLEGSRDTYKGILEYGCGETYDKDM